MIEVGGIYKLKKLNLPYIHNDNDSYEILYEINSNIVACINTSTRERMVLQKQFFIDPEKPDEDSFEGMTIEPTILEEFGGGMAAASAGSVGGAIGGMASLGAAPCPTMAQASNGVSGAMVNGIPVEGQSAMKKKKKKKKKKHETSFSGIVITQEDIDSFDFHEVKKYFQKNIQQQNLYNYCLKDYIKIVGKTFTETQSHKGKTPLFLLFKQLDYLIMTAEGENRMVSNTKQRKDNTIGWYYLFNTALFGQNLLRIKLDIAQSQDGKKVYFISDKTETASVTPSSIEEYCHVGRTTVSNNIITETKENVNPLSLKVGETIDLTPFFHITVLDKPNDFNEIFKETEIDETNIINVSPDEMIEKVEDTFEPNETLITYVASPRERLKITVKYSGEPLTHVLEIAFLNEANDVIDYIYEEGLTTTELIETLQEIFSRHHEIESLREDFNEEYEEITEQIAKYLDRLNFQYANTTDIVYKKEGDYKYLFKFDNEIGIIKIKVLKGNEVLVEKTYEIDETQDVQPIFDEIESIYNQYGV